MADAKYETLGMANALRFWTGIAVAATVCVTHCARADIKEDGTVANSLDRREYLSPAALVASGDGKALFVACATADQVAKLDLTSGRITRRFDTAPSPSGLALSKDGRRLYVTCAGVVSYVCVVEVATGRMTARIPTGHTAMAPVLSLDEKRLYVCNRFNSAVGIINLDSGKEVQRVQVPREPVAAALTKDGKHLLVANHIHNGRADADMVAAVVSVIDVAERNVVKDIALPNGSTLLRDIRVSPDGRYACVTHLLARFHLPTTQIERGWIQSNALTLMDLEEMKLINTVLLDNIDQGAANPWAAAWSPDGERIFATHAGTHELSIIDAPALLAKLSKAPPGRAPGNLAAADVPNDLSFLVGLRKRVKLQGKGPRAIALVNDRVYVGNYFSDSIEAVDTSVESPQSPTIFVLRQRPTSKARLGEMYFNDAELCFQGWLSCASCHSSDARVDGLNWDLLNDGIGNPKNAKNLLLAHQTPPTTALGVRENAEVSVRAGIKHILFTVQPEEVADALDEYLKSLKPMLSPHLVNGKPSASAVRGEKVFRDESVGCSECHKPGLFTTLKAYNVGTQSGVDRGRGKFDTPTLIEAWRSGPYLHDGSAATVRDVITLRNPRDQHGTTSHLTPQQIDDLTAYVLSL